MTADQMPDEQIESAFKAHTEGKETFTRRMAINIGVFFGVTPKELVKRLERMGLLKTGSWDWFIDNGGFTKEHFEEARKDRT